MQKGILGGLFSGFHDAVENDLYARVSLFPFVCSVDQPFAQTPSMAQGSRVCGVHVAPLDDDIIQ